MKYIRTKDGRIIVFGEGEIGYKLGTFKVHNKAGIVASYEPIEVLKIADTIEELCDEFRVRDNDNYSTYEIDITCRDLKELYEELQIQNQTLFGAIWTSKGLIYVAKMNENGELELI